MRDYTLPVAKNMYEPSDKHLAQPYVRAAPEGYLHPGLACFEDCDFGSDTRGDAEDILERQTILRRLDIAQ